MLLILVFLKEGCVPEFAYSVGSVDGQKCIQAYSQAEKKYSEK
jgi:hypothetical protein